jgi:hypothetical protein
VIYVGIDDTDIVGSPGTNQLARKIVRTIGRAGRGAVVCRHQLFFDSRVPYTSQNGSASIQLPHGDELARGDLIASVRQEMRDFFVEGSDPGLAVGTVASREMMAFAARAKVDVVSQADAQNVAHAAACHLEGLGGTNQGIIGALAAVALAAGGNDGRVVHVGDWPWPDPFCGVQPVAAIRDRGVAEVRTTTGDAFTGDRIDVGKHLRPNWRDGRIVLFVAPPEAPGEPWRSHKLD